MIKSMLLENECGAMYYFTLLIETSARVPAPNSLELITDIPFE